MLDKATALKTAEQYAETVKKALSPAAVVFFGSYQNGNPHEDSDIDVGVVFDGFTGDRHETSAYLWKLRRGVSLDIEPHLLDIQNDDSGFARFVYNTGQIIYHA